MSALIFPAAALVLTFLVLTPALTFLSRALLRRRRQSVARWVDFGDDKTFLLIVGPVLFPLIWLVSSAVHEIEPGRALSSCLIEHLDAQQCADAFALLAIVLGLVATTVCRAAWLGWFHPRGERLPGEHPLSRQLKALRSGDPALASIPVHAVVGAPEAIYTRGILRPCIEVDACFVAETDEASLRAALLHEAAHALNRDPLRYILGHLALAFNPARAWLADDFLRWKQAREAACDLEAVNKGGEPLALAHAILRAARFDHSGQMTCRALAPLRGARHAALKLRLALLTGPADHTPAPTRTLMTRALLWGGLCLFALSPHLHGESLVSVLHKHVESLLVHTGLI